MDGHIMSLIQNIQEHRVNGLPINTVGRPSNICHTDDEFIARLQLALKEPRILLQLHGIIKAAIEAENNNDVIEKLIKKYLKEKI